MSKTVNNSLSIFKINRSQLIFADHIHAQMIFFSNRFGGMVIPADRHIFTAQFTVAMDNAVQPDTKIRLIKQPQIHLKTNIIMNECKEEIVN